MNGTTTPLATAGPTGPHAATEPDELRQAAGLDHLLIRARHAGSGWRRTAPADRAAALRAAAAVVRERADELAHVLCDDTGRLWRDARASAVVAADLLDEAAVTGLVGGRALAGGPGTVDLVRPEPRGLIAVLTPWNDPYPAAAGLLAAALVTGNTVVHKPSERSADSGRLLTGLLARALPGGVLTHLGGGPDVGRALVEHQDVAMAAHVGSSVTGAWIRSACAARGAVSITENGGNDPVVVDAGVDPRWAAEQVAVGAFTNAGQLCTSVERVYVHAEVAEEFLDALVARAERLVVGDPRDDSTDVGPLVDEAQVRVVDAHVADALERGARLVTSSTEAGPTARHRRPTVLDGCTDEMLVMTEETFGPVAPVAVVGSWEEGLARAASGRYGLAATVLTRDTGHALDAVDRLEVGTVKVNAVFGGAPGGSADPRRASGRGRGYGPALLDEMVVLKAVHWEPAP
ncbi:MAG: aldehyde dehydrogenase family protein [Dermatophilaceae bacterium]